MTRYHLTHPKDGRFAPAFALYEQSFPIHERRTKQAQQARLGCPGYHFDLLMEGEELQGILLWWEAGPFCYVEHFAIAPQLRGTGIGTRALEQLREEGRRVLLEIDPPVDEGLPPPSAFLREGGLLRQSLPPHPPTLSRGLFRPCAGGDDQSRTGCARGVPGLCPVSGSGGHVGL